MHASVDALRYRGQRPDAHVTSRPHASRQPGERAGRQSVLTVSRNAVSRPGPSPRTQCRTGSGPERHAAGANRRADVPEQDRS